MRLLAAIALVATCLLGGHPAQDDHTIIYCESCGEPVVLSDASYGAYGHKEIEYGLICPDCEGYWFEQFHRVYEC